MSERLDSAAVTVACYTLRLALLTTVGVVWVVVLTAWVFLSWRNALSAVPGVALECGGWRSGWDWPAVAIGWATAVGPTAYRLCHRPDPPVDPGAAEFVAGHLRWRFAGADEA